MEGSSAAACDLCGLLGSSLSASWCEFVLDVLGLATSRSLPSPWDSRNCQKHSQTRNETRAIREVRSRMTGARNWKELGLTKLNLASLMPEYLSTRSHVRNQHKFR